MYLLNIDFKLLSDTYFDDRNNRPESTAILRLLKDNLHQATVDIEVSGTYFVPRCATNYLVPLLNHEHLRWFVIDLNNKKTSGTAAYVDYLKIALDKVSFLDLIICYINEIQSI